MELANCLIEACIQAGTAAATKSAALADLAELICRHPALAGVGRDTVLNGLQEREEIGSTGFGNGIAIPHCALENVDDFAVGLMVAPDGIEYDAIDGKPVKLLVIIVGPASQRSEHVALLSVVSRILTNADAMRELLALTEPLALRESMLRWHAGYLPGESRARCLVQVLVQRQEAFDEALQVFTEAVEGELAVIEANTAGSYLNRLPMFAAFWNDQQKGFFRIIMGVVDKGLVNDVARRLNLVAAKLPEKRGLMVTVQELILVQGAMEL